MSTFGTVEFTNTDEMSFYLDRANLLEQVTSMVDDIEELE